MCAEVAIFAAIGYVLDLLASLYSGYLFPFGGSLSLALIPVVIISFRRGVFPGVISGFIIGLLDMLDGGIPAFTDTWYNYLLMISLDYLLAYTVVGLCGLFKPCIKKLNHKILIPLATL